ncbi:purine-nucleoside phosphorylase [Rhodopirellula sp. MGV]|uniref:purine-nucleoside phosphorylase n=1 Tax=Rhodopirellula sp. MGV TaxID=2023130 RepID=UPI000B96468A|nr:purine-nucleoside phosphorylase [Rhodopirellula sp. MGV]OYP32160.1 purine-nucleoside phosphorylase [Rhodopirellula sp. MGV]PNY35166.1 purine-nucleoside phosphorylase [Rhodopirellula baltica]
MSERTEHHNQLAQAVAFVQHRCPDFATSPNADLTGIVLGSGLGALADKIESTVAIPFAEIPGFGKSTASGHRGQLILGNLDGSAVVAMAGRLHRYEGWSNEQVAFPIEVMVALGIKRFIASNAAGGVNPKLSVGDVVIITDHIDWLHDRQQKALANRRTNSDAGQEFLGRAPQPYSSELAEIALAASREHAFCAVKGTYLATLGPTYETRAEYRMMRKIGADVVGMSTVPEVLVAAKAGIPVLALSIVSNVADPDRAIVADHSEVLQAGDAAAVKLEHIVRRVTHAARTKTIRPKAAD